jgi:DNA-directed RNA polymerase subunit omega
MARVTIEDCEKVEPNRFNIVDIAVARTRRLLAGFDVPSVDLDGDKLTVVALRELAAGFLTKPQEEAPRHDELEDD